MINNKWINDEDNVFLFFGCSLILNEDDYRKKVNQINIKLNELTIKYEILMLLTKEYCDYHGIDITENYKDFLSKNKELPKLFEKNDYEFYKNDINRISKMFYKNIYGELEGKYVHYLVNGLYGIPEVIESRLNMDDVAFLDNYGYMDSPLRVITRDVKLMKDKTIECGFIIESHCSIWMDKTPNFRYMNKNGDIEFFEYSDNKDIAYKNTPRLNSFLRDVKNVILEYGGKCTIYDYESYLKTNNNPKHEAEALNKKGLCLEGRILYQEDFIN